MQFPVDVKRRRLELPRHNCHYPLKVARLPIPPSLQRTKKSKNCVLCIQNMVPKTGLEPARLAAHAPETCASSRHTHLKRARLPIPPLGHLLPCYGLGDCSECQRAESGKRDSNSRPRPWQGRALPTELLPHLRFAVAKVGIFLKLTSVQATFFRLNLFFLSWQIGIALIISPFCPGSLRMKIGGARVPVRLWSTSQWQDGGYR